MKGWSTLLRWRWCPTDSLWIDAIAIDGPNYLLRRLGTHESRNRGRVPTEHIHLTLGVVRAALKRHILPVFVFDGPPESLKREPNPEIVSAAADVYSQFIKEPDAWNDDITALLADSPVLRWYFSVAHVRDLCAACGIPAVTAPSEAEMLAAALCRDGVVGTVVSNDADTLLFGCPHMTRTLHVTEGQIESATLKELEDGTGLTLSQLRDLAVLSGCDFHPKGAKGIGPRRGMLLLQRHGDLDHVLRSLGMAASEREVLLLARIVFDEGEYLCSTNFDTGLRPPVPAALLRLLAPLMGAERADRDVREMIRLWKEFGKEQSSLEQWT